MFAYNPHPSSIAPPHSKSQVFFRSVNGVCIVYKMRIMVRLRPNHYQPLAFASQKIQSLAYAKETPETTFSPISIWGSEYWLNRIGYSHQKPKTGGHSSGSMSPFSPGIAGDCYPIKCTKYDSVDLHPYTPKHEHQKP